MLRHDILTCAQKLMASQLSLPHGIIILTSHQQQTLSFPQEAKLVPWVANPQSHNSGSQILCMGFQTVYRQEAFLSACLSIYSLTSSSFFSFPRVLKNQSALCSVCLHFIQHLQLQRCSSQNLELSPFSSSNVYQPRHFLPLSQDSVVGTQEVQWYKGRHVQRNKVIYLQRLLESAISTGHTSMDIGASANPKVVGKFCYLGDMLSVDGDADAAVEARIRIGWNKFKQLVPLLTNRDILLIKRGRLYSSCVQSSRLHGQSRIKGRKTVVVLCCLKTQ